MNLIRKVALYSTLLGSLALSRATLAASPELSQRNFAADAPVDYFADIPSGWGQLTDDYNNCLMSDFNFRLDNGRLYHSSNGEEGGTENQRSLIERLIDAADPRIVFAATAQPFLQRQNNSYGMDAPQEQFTGQSMEQFTEQLIKNYKSTFTQTGREWIDQKTKGNRPLRFIGYAAETFVKRSLSLGFGGRKTKDRNKRWNGNVTFNYKDRKPSGSLRFGFSW